MKGYYLTDAIAVNDGVSEISFNVQSDPPIDCDLFATKDHYYGQIKKISADDDISSLTRGSVYYLRDHVNNPNSIMHPYIVIQSSYVDKVGRITLLGITSTPSTINMVPIVMDNSISYINPNRVYTYNIDVFSDPSSRLIGNIVNMTAFDVAVNLYGMLLGMNLKKSNDEIVSEYLTYVEEFKERTKHLAPYQPKTTQSNGIDKLSLHTSFDIKYSDDTSSDAIDLSDNEIDAMFDEIDDMIDEECLSPDTNDIQPMSSTESQQISQTSKKSRRRYTAEELDNAINLYRKGKYTYKEIEKKTGVPYASIYREIKKRKNLDETPDNVNMVKKMSLVVDVNNQAVLSAISAIENSPSGVIKLPKSVDKMTDDEKIVFIAYDFLYGAEMASLAYNSTYRTVLKRKSQICEKYDIEYTS